MQIYEIFLRKTTPFLFYIKSTGIILIPTLQAYKWLHKTPHYDSGMNFNTRHKEARIVCIITTIAGYEF